MRAAAAAAALATAAALAGQAHALGMEVGYGAFETADAVSWVQVCGRWGKDHQGSYRVVHAEKYAQSFLYIQWMQPGGAETGYAMKAVHTASVAELNNDHADISLSDLACRSTPRGIVVTARADSGHEEKLRRIAIEAGPAPGQYRYRAQRMR